MIIRFSPVIPCKGWRCYRNQREVKSSARYKEILESTNGRLVPEWLEADADALKGSVKSIPTREVIDVPVNEMLIVELYSK